MPFVKAVSKAELLPGQKKCVLLGGKKIAIFNVEGEYFAVDDRCSHMKASLSEGTALKQDDRCTVECPWHGAQFDLKTGAALTLPAVKPVKSYMVQVRGDDVEIDI
jgi:3-phenylpropionate/trans-cinnamate dioxygenase ferredoxin subunit